MRYEKQSPRRGLVISACLWGCVWMCGGWCITAISFLGVFFNSICDFCFPSVEWDCFKLYSIKWTHLYLEINRLDENACLIFSAEYRVIQRTAALKWRITLLFQPVDTVPCCLNETSLAFLGQNILWIKQQMSAWTSSTWSLNKIVFGVRLFKSKWTPSNSTPFFHVAFKTAPWYHSNP